MSEKMELPKGWILDFLGEYIVKGGGTVDPSRFKDEEFELYSIPAYDSQVPEIVSGAQIGSTKKVVQANDVLLSRIVPHIQRSWVVPATKGKRKIGSGEWIIFRGYTFTPKYLRFFLFSYNFHQKFMKTISGVGGSLTRANPNQVALFSIPLPPLPEQHRIVAKIEELFSRLDKGIENLRTAQAQLKTYRQAVLKWAFEGKLTEVQINFKEKLFGDITELITSGSRGWSDYYSDKGSIFIRAQNIKYDILNLDEIAFVKLPDKAEGLRTRVHQGDLLITITGANVTKTALVVNAVAEAYVSQHVALCRLGSKELLPKYFYWFIVSDTWGRRFLSQKAYGAGKPGLNLQNIQDLPIRYPIFEEQSLIVAEIEKRLSVCDKLEESIAQSLVQAEALRQSILKKAFEGKLVSQDPDDEPASRLLERIRAERAAVGAKNAVSAGGESGVRAKRKGRREADE